MRRLRIVQFVLGDAPNDARVMRACWALRDAGHQILVVGRSREVLGLTSIARMDPIDGMEHWAMPSTLAERYGLILEKLNRLNPLHDEERGIKASMRSAITSSGASAIDRMKTLALAAPYAIAFASHRTGALQKLSKAARLLQRPSAIVRALAKLSPDVIHAHDLYGFALVAEEAHRRGIPVVYDAHELERGRNSPAWSLEQKRAHADLERRLIGLARGVITVAPSIAKILETAYRIPLPTVVVNSPPRSIIRPNRPLRERLGLPTDHRVVLYLGGVSKGRGLERLLRALRWLPTTVHVALMGPMSSDYREPFERLLSDLGDLRHRIHVLGKTPYRDVVHEAWRADLGYNGIELSCESYQNALPNKFFEYVFADVPVLSTPQADPVLLTEEYQLGCIVPDAGAEEIATAIRDALERRIAIPDERRQAFIDRFCFETQAGVLASFYETLDLRNPRRRTST